MTDLIEFAMARLLTKDFWYYVLSSFIGVIIFSMRGNFRNNVFRAAGEAARKGKI